MLDDGFRDPSLDQGLYPVGHECADLLCNKALEGVNAIRPFESAYLGLRLARTIGDLIMSDDDVLDLNGLQADITEAHPNFIRSFPHDYLTIRQSLRVLVRSGMNQLRVAQNSFIAAYTMAGFTLAHIEACQLDAGRRIDVVARNFAVLLEDNNAIEQVVGRWQAQEFEEG